MGEGNTTYGDEDSSDVDAGKVTGCAPPPSTFNKLCAAETFLCRTKMVLFYYYHHYYNYHQYYHHLPSLLQFD